MLLLLFSLASITHPPLKRASIRRKQNCDDDTSFLRLENTKDRLAEAMRATVLAARAINTEDIVRNQLAAAAQSVGELEEQQEAAFSSSSSRFVSSPWIGTRTAQPPSIPSGASLSHKSVR